MKTASQAHNYDALILEDLAYQTSILQGVSRTFALTIPQLPGQLPDVVGNAYLLCRIADTIEDEPNLPLKDKQNFSKYFLDVIKGHKTAEHFSKDLSPLLSPSILKSEHNLIANAAKVLRITHRLPLAQRNAIENCVKTMSRGMMEFQKKTTAKGLDNINQFNRYCYYVAGVVGEMLTEILCDYSSEIKEKRRELMKLSTSFGQGLQMTNILKDVWMDHLRGACWLPKDIFHSSGFNLESLKRGETTPNFILGMNQLIAIARQNLADALQFTLLIPSHETGIRRFCLSSLGMAILTLQRIHAHPHFTSAKEVKISRRSVFITLMMAKLFARSNPVLKILFKILSRGLPSQGLPSRGLPSRGLPK